MLYRRYVGSLPLVVSIFLSIVGFKELEDHLLAHEIDTDKDQVRVNLSMD